MFILLTILCILLNLVYARLQSVKALPFCDKIRVYYYEEGQIIEKCTEGVSDWYDRAIDYTGKSQHTI